jgi:hypothetical protein
MNSCSRNQLLMAMSLHLILMSHKVAVTTAFSTIHSTPLVSSPRQQQRHNKRTNSIYINTRMYDYSYGRGAEIWPPANEEPVRLENSFPNGVLPDSVVDMLGLAGKPPPPPSGTTSARRSKRKYIPQTIRRILRRAANAQGEVASDAPSAIDKTPMFLAALLVLCGMIRPLDALLVSFLTGYFVILNLFARSVRRDGITPVLPVSFSQSLLFVQHCCRIASH